MEGERRGVGGAGGADFGPAMGRRHRSDGRQRPSEAAWSGVLGAGEGRPPNFLESDVRGGSLSVVPFFEITHFF